MQTSFRGSAYDEALEIAHGLDEYNLWLAIYGTEILLEGYVESVQVNGIDVPLPRTELQAHLRAFNAEVERRNSH